MCLFNFTFEHQVLLVNGIILVADTGVRGQWTAGPSNNFEAFE
jgi:hypothetical protein